MSVLELPFSIYDMLADKRPLRGRPTWVSGTKLVFLGQYADDWQKATDTGLAAAGVFYTKVAKRFIKKYGWHFDRWTDKVCPDPDPATIDEDDSQDGLSNEEIAKRHEYYREIRSVSYNRPCLVCVIANGKIVDNGLVPFSLFQSRP